MLRKSSANKASQSDLRKLSSFLQKNAKKQPIHSGSCWRRYTTYGYIMLQQKLIKLIRSEMLDGLVNEYCDSFSSVDLHTVDDKEFAELVKFWRSCDDQQKGFIRSLMRFSSQNSLASLLALIDNSSFCYEAKNELGVNEFKLNAETSQGGVSLEQDLTDVFWEQEQEDGHVK
jgi:hypothetical protein